MKEFSKNDGRLTATRQRLISIEKVPGSHRRLFESPFFEQAGLEKFQ